ncbi:MAG: hypothetical protein IT439_08100 [Phycisphaerales bacterium]|nr:hypothetical protein [Phycisphaerales bacterium]
MCRVVRNVVRIGLITALVGGAAVVIAGPHRVRAMIQQARSSIHARIDASIDDPAALRAQLKDLESQYPKRLAEVRRDLDEVEGQIAQVSRDLAVSQRVVALASDDESRLRDGLAEARAQGGFSRVKFDEVVLSSQQAYARADSIRQVREAYSARAVDLDRELGFLGEQRDRLAGLLAQLETEQAEFQAQLWQLDRQIDAVGRNDRLIAVMEKRQQRIDEHSRYEGISLDAIRGRLSTIRAQQESTLNRLAGAASTQSYEDRARFEVETLPEVGGAPTEPVINLDEHDAAPGKDAPAAPRRLASRDN